MAFIYRGYQYRIRSTRSTNGISSAEFAICLFVFLLFFLFPMINFVAYVAGTSLTTFLCKDAATQAARSARYSDALKAVSVCEQRVESGIIPLLIKLKPVASPAKGCNLYVTVTDLETKSATTFGPNIPYKNPINPESKIYEYTVTAKFTVGPLLNLKGIPGLGTIPVAGKEAKFSCSSSAPCENPEGLSS